ncbi:MAG: hypothetical protein LBS86_04350 [Treponema sp.]|jgi:hypothetical protein|nr:hypothetical protein [Treponema sp.]
MSGRGGNNRRNFRRRERDNEKSGKKGDAPRYASDRGYERLRWVPPAAPSGELPTPECPYCGKLIRDITSAVGDRDGETPAHFECVMARLVEREKLEKGDTFAYIGGGRFGIVVRSGSSAFKIRKIMEWEDKEHRAEWRRAISEQYSST